ncbi:trypsin-1-like [Anopheles bellator]|uniref:trypsin-1-like n=1 Tax=Anopheles bellator TaxID=139047 RepID=UPI00264763B8|nr:trypsin-1-like [Anopheles bellator]
MVQAQDRMVGASDTTVEEYPFMAAITFHRELVGNGAIINMKWILTAAITIIGTPVSAFDVRVGSSDYKNNPKVYQVKRNYPHPEWVGYDYNIGLVLLAKELDCSPTVQPIRLTTEDPESIQLTMVSYGQNEAGTSHLQKANFDMTRSASCYNKLEDFLSKEVVETGTGYCMSSPDITKKGHYYTDLGAPAITKNKLYALFSFSEHSGGITEVAVATRVFPYIDFISQTTNRFS